MNVHSEDSFFSAVRKALDNAVHECIEEEIAAACINLEAKLRKRAGELALSTLNYYSAETNGRELRITVKLPEKI